MKKNCHVRLRHQNIYFLQKNKHQLHLEKLININILYILFLLNICLLKVLF